MQILVTGANGYIGRNLCRFLMGEGHQVRALLRRPADLPAGIEQHVVDQYDTRETQDITPFVGIDAVIHAAGRAHHQRENPVKVAALYQQDNIDLALRVAGMAARAKVKRFIFLSSIGAGLLEDRFHEGRMTMPGAWNEHPYRASKLVAERELAKLAKTTPMEIVRVRLPMVYGRQAPGNFSSLSRMIRLGWPLPLGSFNNLRAFASIATVEDFISRCLTHPLAATRIWSIRDRDELSPPDFALSLAEAAKLPPPRLFTCPPWLLRGGAALFGFAQTVRNITESAQVDLGPTNAKLGWQPPVSVAEGLRKAF